ncbi:hypothetical protein EN859_015700 [Mesorhizobium sp. M00.F.Ca.ET.216.01.1.1]|nr:hypothetical protein EN859_015700 [Mesorhizobium sp. M00.F.Ca.ET.216.01.1.1]TJW40637.1 MAG: hypothetical protein E5W83_28030 [Mesorhizobium sp.]
MPVIELTGLPNDNAIVRLVGAILLEQNDEWAVQRAKYMTLVWMPAVLQRRAPAGQQLIARPIHPSAGRDGFSLQQTPSSGIVPQPKRSPTAQERANVRGRGTEKSGRRICD